MRGAHSADRMLSPVGASSTKAKGLSRVYNPCTGDYRCMDVGAFGPMAVLSPAEQGRTVAPGLDVLQQRTQGQVEILPVSAILAARCQYTPRHHSPKPRFTPRTLVIRVFCSPC